MIYLYRVLNLLILPFVLFLGPLFSKKMRRWFFRPRKFQKSKFKSLWIHASSGEFEHAKALIRELKNRYPYKRIIVTYSSPSYANNIAKNMFVDGYIPLPLDIKGAMQSLINRINPDVVMFARTDLWPELMHQLKRKKIPTFVFAKMHSNKKAPSVFKRLYSYLTLLKASHISFVSRQDLENFTKHYKHDSISSCGDPRFDEVIYRLSNIKTKKLQSTETTFILGSVWPKDMAALTPTLKKLLDNKSITKLIVVPHEPALPFVSQIRGSFDAYGSQVDVIAKQGVLFDLYANADLAFVGGSFKKKVHSVLEPLSHGLKVFVGPKHSNNAEALSFKQFGYVEELKEPNQFYNQITTCLKNLPSRENIQKKVASQSGATSKVLDKIKPHLSNLI